VNFNVRYEILIRYCVKKECQYHRTLHQLFIYVWKVGVRSGERSSYSILAVTNLRVPNKAENFLTTCATRSFSRRTVLHVDVY
jgi:hypothetical protein